MRCPLTRNLTPITLTLATVALLTATATLHAQAPTKRKGPTIQELQQQQIIDLQTRGQGLQEQVQKRQQQVIDLQGKLLECQGAVKSNAPNPMKEAFEAFQTFDSTVNTGANYTVYRDALITLKVKVDRLPWDDSTAPMKRAVAQFVDAGTLWNTFLVTRGRGSFSIEASPILAKYGYNPKNPPSLDQAYSQLIQRGLTEARGFKLSDIEKNAKVSAPTPDAVDIPVSKTDGTLNPKEGHTSGEEVNRKQAEKWISSLNYWPITVHWTNCQKAFEKCSTSEYGNFKKVKPPAEGEIWRAAYTSQGGGGQWNGQDHYFFFTTNGIYRLIRDSYYVFDGDKWIKKEK